MTMFGPSLTKRFANSLLAPEAITSRGIARRVSPRVLPRVQDRNSTSAAAVQSHYHECDVAHHSLPEESPFRQSPLTVQQRRFLDSAVCIVSSTMLREF